VPENAKKKMLLANLPAKDVTNCCGGNLGEKQEKAN